MKPYHSALVDKIPEASWQTTVIDLAQTYNWDYWHDTDSRKSKAGLPDLLLWKPGQFMACELKKETGVISNDQAVMLHAWELAGVEVHVWRPSMLVDVERRLRTR